MSKHWVTEGFEAFRKGRFGNGGQNIYVSRRGVLQRIYQYDLTGNGYMDLVFANCQNHHESAESFVYRNIFSAEVECTELPAQGAASGAVVDLNNSGFDDLVIANRYDMAAPFASSEIFYGSSDATYSEKRHMRIPTPWAESCCAGRFNNSDRPTLAFSLTPYKVIRFFYPSELGVEWDRFTDLELPNGQLTAADLDGDGYDELIIHENNTAKVFIFWGSAGGINPDDFLLLEPSEADVAQAQKKHDESTASQLERKLQSPPLPRVITLGGKQLLAICNPTQVIFYEFEQRNVRHNSSIQISNPLTVAVSQPRADRSAWFFIAARDNHNGASDKEFCYLYRADAAGNIDLDNVKVLETVQVSDAVFGDFSGRGTADLAICQSHTQSTYTNEVLVFAEADLEELKNPVRLHCEDAQRIFAVRTPGAADALAVINHYSRSSVGFDKSYIYIGDADGYRPDRRIEVPGWCAVDSLMLDLNDDGKPELVICNNSENSMQLDPGTHIHFFNEQGEFDPQQSYLIQTDLGWGGVAGDFRRSGYIDLVFVCNRYKDIRIFHGSDQPYSKENSTFIELVDENGNHFGSPRWIYAVDLNNNGYLDLVIPSISGNRTLILHGSAEGFSMKNRTELAVRHGACARAADFTGNGYADLVIGSHTDTPVNGELTPHYPHHSYVHIYWNGPEGLSENNKTILRADACDAMCVGDFNRDGNLDLFCCSYHGGVDRDIHSFLYWNRDGLFRAADRQLIYTHSASGCIAADFNEDGFVDLAVANHKVNGDHLGFSSVWYNGPEGFDKRNRIDLPTAGPHGMTSVEPGNILTRGPEEYYYSAPEEAPAANEVKSIAITAEIPPKCSVKIALRRGNTPCELENAAWSSEFCADDAVPEVPGSGNFWQYRLNLEAVNSLRSPRVTKVDILFD